MTTSRRAKQEMTKCGLMQVTDIGSSILSPSDHRTTQQVSKRLVRWSGGRRSWPSDP